MVQGLGFRAWGVGFGDEDVGFCMRVHISNLRVLGLFGVHGIQKYELKYGFGIK